MDLAEELAWLRFYLPRQAVQLAARHLPLAALRDRLPRALSERLRFGLYPARVSDPAAVACARRHAAWGDPATLDPGRPLAWTAPPRASILVVTYGNLALTQLCLASVQRAAGALPFEVIVVDNASRDGTPEWLAAEAERGLLPLVVELNRHNAGFAAANNQAAARARGDVLVFLNNDCVVTPGWLETLCGHLARDPGLGLVGPVTNSAGNAASQLAAVPYGDLDGMFAFAAEYTRAHAGELVAADMLPLFCAAAPRARFAAAGGLDERYRVGMFEDDDLAMALSRLGARVAVAHDAFVHHYGGASFANLPPPQYLRLWWENRRRYEAKWATPWRPR